MDKQERIDQTVEQITKALLDGEKVKVNYSGLLRFEFVSHAMSDAIEHFYNTHSEDDIEEYDEAVRQVFHGETEPLRKYLESIAIDFAVYIVDDVIDYEDEQLKQAQIEDKADWGNMQ